jgi:asparagine synthase (glutamine-hydrolysing)
MVGPAATMQRAAESRTVDVQLSAGDRWQRCVNGAVTLWWKGWLSGASGADLATRLAGAGDLVSPAWLGKLLRETDGHFALAARGPGWAFAAVDWVRSIPLAAARSGGGWRIDDRPERLRRLVGLAAADIDPDAALGLAMAGFTIDAATLYRGIELLVPGELLWIGADGAMSRHRYYIYRPWRLRAASSGALEAELAETTLAIMERTLASLGGRTVVIPLSAGYDSRLIASAARHLGYDNVCCFSYGRAGNFEAKASKAIADKLGYPWSFVPLTIPGQRRFFASDDYARYVEMCDSGASVPFVQDMGPLMALKGNSFVPDDAVIINGNSGDYIAGNHIPPDLRRPQPGLDAETRWWRILDALIYKHFSLWAALKTKTNLARIRERLRASIVRAGGVLDDPAADHGLYEYAEFQDRQCKYVVTGQRIYEFLGHDWRLPLWDNAYLRFWEGVPLAEKAGQGLYARMLHKANWGGVWRDIPVNRKTVRPLWLVPLRFAAKAAHAPLGRGRWRAFERQYLQYWMDNGCSSACVPYWRSVRDRRGARNHISWLASSYLARHGMNIDDWGASAICERPRNRA